MENMEEVREQFPITRNRVFLNHAAHSPLPKPVAEAILRYVNESSNFWTDSSELDDGGKPLFAELIGAKPEEIAFVENTSMGLNIAANVLHYPCGSKVVTTDLEFPSVVYPWLRRSLNVKVHYIKNTDGKISLDDFEKAVDDKTVAVVISHVEYVNGLRHDLRGISEIAHDHGAYLIVDAIQSAGAIRIDVKKDNVDFLVAACYKWLLSPPGAGYLYVKDDLIGKLEPTFVGWASVKKEVFETSDFWDIWNLNLSETASRFEIGSRSLISFAGAREAMKMLLNFGIGRIERRVLKLTDYLIEATRNLGLKLQTPEEPQYRSGIINIRINKSQEIVKELGGKGIIVSARAHGLRVSPHFYNTETEIDRLIEELKNFK